MAGGVCSDEFSNTPTYDTLMCAIMPHLITAQCAWDDAMTTLSATSDTVAPIGNAYKDSLWTTWVDNAGYTGNDDCEPSYDLDENHGTFGGPRYSGVTAPVTAPVTGPPVIVEEVTHSSCPTAEDAAASDCCSCKSDEAGWEPPDLYSNGCCSDCTAVCTATTTAAAPVVDVDSSTWPAEAQKLIDMGGCTMVSTAMGLPDLGSCNADLMASATIQGLAAGLTGNLCDYCPATCADLGEVCVPAADSMDPSKYWRPR